MAGLLRSSGPAVRPGRRLLSVTVLLAGGLGGIGALLALNASQARREQALTDLQTKAQASASDAGQFVRGRLELLSAIGAQPAFAGERPSEARRVVARLRPGELGLTGGVVWLPVERASRADADDRVVAEVVRTRAPWVGPVASVRALGPQPVLPIGVPTFDDVDRTSGVLVGGLTLPFLDRVAANVGRVLEGDVVVLDRAGMIVAGGGTRAPRAAPAELLERVRAQRRGVATDVEGAGEGDRVLAWGSSEPAGSTGLTLVLERREDAVLAPVRRRLARDLGLIALLVALGVAIAVLVGRRLDRAAAQEHEIAEALQRTLLPDRLPELAAAPLAARYRPATAGLQVGGDWYDVFCLEEERLALCVGDVVGHGLHAAASMGRLRSAVATGALTGDGPGAALAALRRYNDATQVTDFATLAYAELDLVSGELTYLCAGHPPPLLVPPRHAARYLDAGRSTPLGAPPADPSPAGTATLTPGTTLVLYTDGLVERRQTSLDGRLAHLRQAAEDQRDLPLGEFTDRLLEAFSPGAVDDIAVLCLRWLGTPATHAGRAGGHQAPSAAQVSSGDRPPRSG